MLHCGSYISSFPHWCVGAGEGAHDSAASSRETLAPLNPSIHQCLLSLALSSHLGAINSWEQGF